MPKWFRRSPVAPGGRPRGRPLRILYVVHALPPEERSGTPLATATYAARLAERGHQAVVVHGGREVTRWPGPSEAVRDQAGFLRYAVPLTPRHAERWAVEEAGATPDGAAESAFVELLRTVTPDLVHVVDNVNLPLSLPECAAREGYPVLRTVSCAEDLCGLIAPVSGRSDPVGYCQAPIGVERCAACIETTAVYRDDRSALVCEAGEDLRAALIRHLALKRSRAQRQFRDVFSEVIFSTESFRRYFEATLPLDPETVHVIGMGVDPVVTPRPDGGQERSIVQIGLVGMLDRAKGIDTVVRAFTEESLRARPDYRLVIRGGGDVSLIEPLLEANPNVSHDGPYGEAELAELLGSLDLGISASRFETFHRVTREYLLAGIPVIGSNVLGIAEVLRHEENGLGFSHDDEGSLGRAVSRCLDDRALVAKLRAGARATKVRSVDEEIDDLVSLYQRTRPTSRRMKTSQLR